MAGGRVLSPRRESTGTTIQELCAAFMQSGMATASHADDYKAVIKLLVSVYGTTEISDFGPLALQVVRQKMVAASAQERMQAEVQKQTSILQKIEARLESSSLTDILKNGFHAALKMLPIPKFLPLP